MRDGPSPHSNRPRSQPESATHHARKSWVNRFERYLTYPEFLADGEAKGKPRITMEA